MRQLLLFTSRSNIQTIEGAAKNLINTTQIKNGELLKRLKITPENTLKLDDSIIIGGDITSIVNKVTVLETHAANSEIHITGEERTRWNDKYTKNEVNNLISTLSKDLDWKESVNTEADLPTTYPDAVEGWICNVKNYNNTNRPSLMRYTGTQWEQVFTPPPPATYSAVTETEAGLMTPALLTKLNGIEEQANKYILPANLPAEIITETADKKFVSDTEKAGWTAKLDKTTADGLYAAKTDIEAISKKKYQLDKIPFASITGGNTITITQTPIITDRIILTVNGVVYYQPDSFTVDADQKKITWLAPFAFDSDDVIVVEYYYIEQ